MKLNLSLLGFLLAGCGQPPAGDFNVVLISIDSLRQDRLGIYGHRPAYAPDFPVSPRIDQLAMEGVVFDNAWSTSSWTLPSHAALMTGLSDLGHGVEIDDFRIDPAHPVLARAFQEAGYSTGGFFSGPYLDPKYGFSRGFETYESGMMGPNELASHLKDWSVRQVAAGKEKPGESILRQIRDRVSHWDITSPRINRMATDFLDEHAGERFFLFLHYFDVHYDHLPGKADPTLQKAFDPDYQGFFPAENWYFNPAVRNPESPHERRISARDLGHIQAMYDAEIHWVDRHVGQILDRISSLGLENETIVIVLADHGDEFFEHGGIGHRSTLHEELLAIPLVVKVPGMAGAGNRAQGNARIYDLAPTLLDLAGLPALASAEGVSLRPLLTDPQHLGSGALCRLFAGTSTGPNIRDGWRNERFTVLREFGIDGRASGPELLQVRPKRLKETGAPFLVFDRDEDPGESRPLPPGDPRYPLAVDLFCQDFRNSAAHSSQVGKSTLQARHAPRKSEEEIATLAAMGYTDGSAQDGDSPRTPPLGPFPEPCLRP